MYLHEQTYGDMFQIALKDFNDAYIPRVWQSINLTGNLPSIIFIRMYLASLHD